jgi:hypothetical protein
MLSVTTNTIMLNVVMLSVVMLNVVAPQNWAKQKNRSKAATIFFSLFDDLDNFDRKPKNFLFFWTQISTSQGPVL